MTPIQFIRTYIWGEMQIDAGARARPAWHAHAAPQGRKRYFRLF